MHSLHGGTFDRVVRGTNSLDSRFFLETTYNPNVKSTWNTRLDGVMFVFFRSLLTALGLCVCWLSVANAQFRSHAPYQDQLFELDHTPKYFYGAQPQYGGYYSSHPCGCGTVQAGSSAYCGAQVADCPPKTTAHLQLYVDDSMVVKINGQQTKTQFLAGVHRNSRVFTLTGLSAHHDGLCEITILTCDRAGDSVEKTHQLMVRAGQRYVCRYPQDFITFAPSELLEYAPGFPSHEVVPLSDLPVLEGPET